MCADENHKTSENIKKHGAFTLSIADIPHIESADFFGIASGNKMPDKFERSGLTAVKSEKGGRTHRAGVPADIDTNPPV